MPLPLKVPNIPLNEVGTRDFDLQFHRVYGPDTDTSLWNRTPNNRSTSAASMARAIAWFCRTAASAGVLLGATPARSVL